VVHVGSSGHTQKKNGLHAAMWGEPMFPIFNGAKMGPWAPISIRRTLGLHTSRAASDDLIHC
jgi:hypothetical protein